MKMTDFERLTCGCIDTNITIVFQKISSQVGILMHTHVRNILLILHVNISDNFKVIKLFVSPLLVKHGSLAIERERECGNLHG